MPLDDEQDPVTGIYKCSDPVHKLKIKVYLRHVKAAHIPLPRFGNDEKEREHDGASSVSVTGSVSASAASEMRLSETDGEERTFSWQEKVFSPFEMEFYNDVANCHTALEGQYHQRVAQLRSQHNQQNRIFSYVHSDDISSLEEANDVTVGSKPFKNHLVQVLGRLQDNQNHTLFKPRRKDVKHPKSQIVEEHKDPATRFLQGFLQAGFQKMYILADLSTSNDVGRSEYILCALRWDTVNGSLLVTPDLCGSPAVTPPYRIEVDGDARNVYEYWLENVSGDINEVERLHEAELRTKVAKFKHSPSSERLSATGDGCINGLMKLEEDVRKAERFKFQFWKGYCQYSHCLLKMVFYMLENTEIWQPTTLMYSHQAELRRNRVGMDFSPPCINTLSTHVLGQITSLRNFEDHSLFIHYFVELPKGWSSECSEQLCGVTASCRALNGRVHLGHPLQIHLNYSLTELEESSERVPRWPQLLLEVLSLDWWGRYRTEGYGYVTLPVTPGPHCITVHTWRPIGRTATSELRRFFIGGNPELDDPTFVGVPVEHESPLLGKYGVETVPGGEVDLNLHVVLQPPTASTVSEAGAPTALLERLSAATLVNSVNQVLAAFRKAHKRMLAAKKGLDFPEQQVVVS